MGSGGGLEAVLAEHEPHTAQGGVFCECGAWEHYYDGSGSEETYAQHLATALAAHLEAVAASQAASEATWQAVADVRDAYPRVADDAPSEDVADAAVTAFLRAVTR